MDQDVELLINEIGIDKDCANGIVIELREVGASALKKVTLISKERGYQAKVEDFNGNVYYIGLGSLGYLEYIRENSGDGKLLFFVTDD